VSENQNKLEEKITNLESTLKLTKVQLERVQKERDAVINDNKSFAAKFDDLCERYEDIYRTMVQNHQVNIDTNRKLETLAKNIPFQVRNEVQACRAEMMAPPHTQPNWTPHFLNPLHNVQQRHYPPSGGPVQQRTDDHHHHEEANLVRKVVQMFNTKTTNFQDLNHFITENKSMFTMMLQKMGSAPNSNINNN
jgi:hypothetical protein